MVITQGLPSDKTLIDVIGTAEQKTEAYKLDDEKRRGILARIAIEDFLNGRITRSDLYAKYHKYNLKVGE